MSTHYRHASHYLEEILRSQTIDQFAQQLEAKHGDTSAKMPGGSRLTAEAVERRWQALQATDSVSISRCPNVRADASLSSEY
jgi:hydroxymethylglutaryl-CoA reductase (NADPH)